MRAADCLGLHFLHGYTPRKSTQVLCPFGLVVARLTPYCRLRSVGWVVLVLHMLYRKDLYSGHSSRCIAQWSLLHRFNFIVLLMHVLYQVSLLDNAYVSDLIVRCFAQIPYISYSTPLTRLYATHWERIIGLCKFAQ